LVRCPVNTLRPVSASHEGHAEEQYDQNRLQILYRISHYASVLHPRAVATSIVYFRGEAVVQGKQRIYRQNDSGVSTTAYAFDCFFIANFGPENAPEEGCRT